MNLPRLHEYTSTPGHTHSVHLMTSEHLTSSSNEDAVDQRNLPLLTTDKRLTTAMIHWIEQGASVVLTSGSNLEGQRSVARSRRHPRRKGSGARLKGHHTLGAP